MITYCGELTIGGALPGAQAAAVAGVSGINAALPDILARIAALQAFAPQPVSFVAQLALAMQIVTGIQTSIALGISPPSIAAQLAAVAALVADLLAMVTDIHAQLAIVLELRGLLGAAGIHAYAFAGQSGNLGGELATALTTGTPGGSAADAANALVLVTTLPATWTALSQIARVTP
jgi:hypothetical protein